MEVVIALAAAALIIAGVSLVYTIRQQKKVRVEEQDLALVLAEEYSKRIGKLEGKIVDLQVQLDVILVNLERKGKIVKEEPATRVAMGKVISPHRRDVVISRAGELSVFEINVLRCISDGAKSPAEVRAVVGHTREHVSRALKRLYDLGYLTRNGARPFIYTLSEKGRSLLSG